MPTATVESIFLKTYLTSVLGTTPAINWEEMTIGSIALPTGYTSVTLTFYAASDPASTFRPCYTAAGVAITQTVAAARQYELPAALAGMGWIKIVTNADDSTKLVEITGK